MIVKRDDQIERRSRIQSIEELRAHFDRWFADWMIDRSADLRAAGAGYEEIERDLADCIAIWPEMRAAAIEEFRRGMLNG